MLDPINIIDIGCLLSAISYIVLRVAAATNQQKLCPPFLQQIFFYGKISEDGESFLLLVPKSWFRYMYIFGTAWSSLVIILTIQGLFSTATIPSWFITLLDFLCGKERTVRTTSAETILALILLYSQIIRRLYETLFLQVFSKKGKMHAMMLIFGWMFYFSSVILVVCRGPGFVPDTLLTSINFRDFSWRLYIFGATFIFASYQQFNSNRILVGLRCKSGKVASEEHFVPSGGYFEWISSPHMLFECLIYLSLLGILWKNQSFWFLVLHVVTCQCTIAQETHNWYRKTFPDYPANRRAIIPFLL